MFDVLLASGTHLQLRPKWVTTSMVTHALIIALAVVATRGALDAARVAVPETAMLLFIPKPPEPPPPPEPKTAPAPHLVVAEPPPKGFQTVAAPIDIPNVIPPVDLKQRPLDPRDFTGIGVEGGVANGVVGGGIGIAIGSAAKTAAIHSIDCRCQTRIAVAARKLGIIAADGSG